MDPTACVQRILDACREGDSDEYASAWSDLAYWMERGGFAPTVRTLGVREVTTLYGVETHERRRIESPDGRYAIQSVNPNGIEDGFAFVQYDFRGMVRKVVNCQ